MRSSFHTIRALIAVFATRQRWFLLPLVFILILAAALMVATAAAPALAPFVYIAF